MELRGNLATQRVNKINNKINNGTNIKNLAQLDLAITQCGKCPRLVQWREEVAITKRKSYQNESYWGRAVPGFGDPKPKLLIIGLAPGAHGANRTGRIFTGDSSGDWLYGSLHRLGIAKIPTSTSLSDGQSLKGTRITCAVHCAPPDNKPSNEERDTCAGWLQRELDLLPEVKTFVVLGKFAFDTLLKNLRSRGHEIPKSSFAHGHSIKYKYDGHDYLVVSSYHPSQQNTFTGKLTKSMLDSALKKAARHAGLSS